MDENKQTQKLDCPYNFTSRCTMGRCDCKPIIPAGAEWEVTRMYNEKDLLSAFEAGMMFIGEDKGSFKEWLAKYKGDKK